MNNNVTFIIPNRGGKNIPYVINNFETTFRDFFEKISFIIVEQDDNHPFKRGQLFNIGVKYANSEWIGLIDNDIINLDKFNPIEVYQQFDNNPYVAFNKISQVTLNNDGGYKITNTASQLAGFGAFNFMRKDDFLRVNGFSNLCSGWGAEDNLLDSKIKFKRYTHTLGHITHPRRNRDTLDLFTFNGKIFSRYKQKTIDTMLDGYLQTAHTLTKKTVNKNITTLCVNNIGVTSDFTYMKEYEEMCKIEKKYIPKTEEVKKEEQEVKKIVETKKEETKKVETKNEKLIISMTSWKKRLSNIPTVLDSIFKQTKQPDKIVINLSIEEFPEKEKELPTTLLEYLKTHSIVEINWVDGPNTKQWKKFIPTLQRYPNGTIICIDDDFIYPQDMVETFWNAHIKNPNNPLSGNSFKFSGIQCHCGCASLVRTEYLKGMYEMLNEETMKHQSSDLFYTYVAAKAGTPYIYCGKSYSTNMKAFNAVNPLRTVVKEGNPLWGMWNYLIKTYRKIGENKPIVKEVTKQTVEETKKPEPVKTKQEEIFAKKNLVNILYGPQMGF